MQKTPAFNSKEGTNHTMCHVGNPDEQQDTPAVMPGPDTLWSPLSESLTLRRQDVTCEEAAVRTAKRQSTSSTEQDIGEHT